MFSQCCIALVALRVATAQLIIEPSSLTRDETVVASGGIILETFVTQPSRAFSFSDAFDLKTTDRVISEVETTKVPTTSSEEKLLLDTSVPPVVPDQTASDTVSSSSISKTGSTRSSGSITRTASSQITSTPRSVATPTAVLTPGNGTLTAIRNSTRTETDASRTVLPTSGSGGAGSGSGGKPKEGTDNKDEEEDEDEDEDDEDDEDEDDEDSDDEEEDDEDEEDEEEEDGADGSSSSDSGSGSDSADATTLTSAIRAGETAAAESASAGEAPSVAHRASPRGALLCLSVLIMGAAVLV
ncbi:hypothetical protein ACHAPT_002035 [Fusarium lateritium]